ncbi:hypothetical protein F4777DRAFT_573525 [Nemania sp. FL0916]|nr:hypothetical protein F4777DRAFT_573525 [Nemania sp. FL0916]
MASSSTPTPAPAPSSSSPAPPPPPPPPPSTVTVAPDKYNNKNPIIHNVALGVTPVALCAMFLPPRRLDLRVVVLGGVALWGTNQLVRDYTGWSVPERLSSRLSRFMSRELPERAQVVQARIREEKAARERQRLLAAMRDDLRREKAAAAAAAPPNTNTTITAAWTEADEKRLREVFRERYEQEQAEKQGPSIGDAGAMKRIWMGDAPPDWKEKRLEKEREALSEGGIGYSGLIMEHLSEAWGGSKKSEGGADKKDGDREKEKGKETADGDAKKS